MTGEHKAGALVPRGSIGTMARAMPPEASPGAVDLAAAARAPAPTKRVVINAALRRRPRAIEAPPAARLQRRRPPPARERWRRPGCGSARGDAPRAGGHRRGGWRRRDAFEDSCGGSRLSSRVASSEVALAFCSGDDGAAAEEERRTCTAAACDAQKGCPSSSKRTGSSWLRARSWRPSAPQRAAARCGARCAASGAPGGAPAWPSEWTCGFPRRTWRADPFWRPRLFERRPMSYAPCQCCARGRAPADRA